MNQPKVRIYVGKIEEWTGDISDCQKKAESICGRRLLAYGLKDMGVEGIFPLHCKADEVYEILERQIEKGVHGKPYLRDFGNLHFNISHTGKYAACALSSVPCGLDIQEIRPIRTKKIVTRTLTEEEQETMEKADNPEKEFFRYWTMKESFLKLTGDGITKDMKNLEKPAWYDCFEIKEDISCCVSAEESCQLFCREISAEEFFSMFGMQ